MSDVASLPTLTLATTYAYCAGLLDEDEFDGPDGTLCERWAVPLTTQFVVPTGCPEVIVQSSVGVDPECRPDGFFQVWWNDGYYSPAVCPEGYVVACTGTGESLNYELIGPAETAAACLPSGFTCDIGSGENQNVFWGDGEYTDIDGFVTGIAAAIQIRWTEDDLSLLPFHPMENANLITEAPTSSSPTSTAAPTSTRAPSTAPEEPSNTSAPASSSSSEPSSEASSGAGSGSGSGTPVGAIAGGVVGGVAALALIGVLIFLLVRRRNQKNKAEAADQQQAQQGGMPPMFPPGQPPMQQMGPGPHQPYPVGPGGGMMMAHTTTPPPPPGSVAAYDPNAVGGMHMAGAQHPPSMYGGAGYPPAPVAYPAPTHSPDGGMAHVYPKPSPAAHTTELAHGNDLEVASMGPPRSEAGAGNEEWERQQLMIRQNQLNERRARLMQLEHINQEEDAIRQRLSTMPPQ